MTGSVGDKDVVGGDSVVVGVGIMRPRLIYRQKTIPANITKIIIGTLTLDLLIMLPSLVVKVWKISLKGCYNAAI